MNSKLKGLFGLILMGTLVAFAYAAVNYAGSYGRSIESYGGRSFSVSAEGKVVAIPDIARFTFRVLSEAKGSDVAALQKNNSDKVNSAISFLKGNGVEEKDISTENYNIAPEYQDFGCSDISRGCPPPVITGYTVDQSVGVKVRNFTKAGDFLSGVVKNGANSVSQLSFTIDDKTALENQARAEALKKAQEKAVLIAKASGFSLGKILSIDEGSSPIYYGAESAMSKSIASPAPASPNIEPGSQDITVTMTLRYEIE